MKIAIVGSGIAGLTVAHRLRREHDITVFEANDRAGGHTHTIDVEEHGRTLAIDTGFIVFNDWTYPNFIALLDELGVASQPSDMSFSLRCERTGLEFCGTSFNTLFAQRRNLVSPAFLRMLLDIVRFNARATASADALDPALTLGDYLEQHRYSRALREHYIVPMGRAIWSASATALLDFPARFFIDFFARHGFLSVNDRPQWRAITGGSREYVRKLTAALADVRLRAAVHSVRRLPHQVIVQTASSSEHFDQVFLACHSDEALALLESPTAAEREVLSAITYQANEITLHADATLLPRRRRAHAAWNYHLLADAQEEVAITYYMNRLQSLPTHTPYLVTLNHGRAIDPRRVLGRYQYSHPVYTPAAVRAQGRHRELNGACRTYFCGAYWRSGFHEDGVTSALAALAHFRSDQDRRDAPLARAG